MTLVFRDSNPNDIAIVCDLESTGLNAEKDVILEAAFIAVDSQFKELGRLHFLMNYNMPFIKGIMNDYVRTMHEENGLLKRLEESTNKLSEQEARDTLTSWLSSVKNPDGRALMMGNSVHGVDWPFLKALVPGAFNRDTGLDYRVIDVSSFREGIALFTGKEPVFQKDGQHRAMGDAMQCLEEFLAILRACVKIPE